MSNETRKSKRAEFDFTKRINAKSLHELFLFQPNAQAFVRNCTDWIRLQTQKKKAPAPPENASSQGAPSVAGSGE